MLHENVMGMEDDCRNAAWASDVQCCLYGYFTFDYLRVPFLVRGGAQPQCYQFTLRDAIPASLEDAVAAPLQRPCHRRALLQQSLRQHSVEQLNNKNDIISPHTSPRVRCGGCQWTPTIIPNKMGPEDPEITAEPASNDRHSTVSKNVRDNSTVNDDINQSFDPDYGNCISSPVNDKKGVLSASTLQKDAMTQTRTLVTEHLRLVAEPDSTPFNVEHEASPLNSTNSLASDKSKRKIDLAINIQVVRQKTLLPVIKISVPGQKCSVFSELRAEVVAASWKTAQVDNFRKVAFRLEEDGKVASMTIAPTRIDAQTPLPGRIYEGWYHRIQRGELESYKVDVKIDL